MLADSYDATGYGLAGALNVSTSNGNFNQFEGLGGNDTITGNGNTQILFVRRPACRSTWPAATSMAMPRSTTSLLPTSTASRAAISPIPTWRPDLAGSTASRAWAATTVVTGNGNTQIFFNNATAGVTVDFVTGKCHWGCIGRIRHLHRRYQQCRRLEFQRYDFGQQHQRNHARNGGAGNDIINGSGGDDTVTGGPGADTFVYATGGGADQITDFNRTQGVRPHRRLTGSLERYFQSCFSDVQSHAATAGLEHGHYVHPGQQRLRCENVAVG